MKAINKTLSILKKKVGFDFFSFKTKIRCGFELETQETNGYTSGDGETDFSSAHEEISSIANSQLESHSHTYDLIDDYMDSTHFLFNLDREKLHKVMDALNCNDLYDLAQIDDNIDLDDIRNKLRESIEEDFDYSEYTEEGTERVEHLTPKNMIVETDSSVDGFEFKTDGPRTYSQFLKSANDIFKIDHDINEECSYHIHLSVDGIYHKGGKNLLRLAQQYVLENIFQYDWSSERMDNRRFFKPTIDGEAKYSLIRFHERFRTFEFRIFGNIKSAKEAKQALDLAIQALWYAYQTILSNKTEKELLVLNENAWLELCKESMRKRIAPSQLNDKLVACKFVDLKNHLTLVA